MWTNLIREKLIVNAVENIRMTRGSIEHLEGTLIEGSPFPVLRMAEGGQWRLDLNGRWRHLLGRRVRIRGRRSDFDMIDVTHIEPA
jgi:hypothetical protein